MGRPRKSGDDGRSCWVHIRLTPEQSLSAKMNAAAAGVTVSELGRRRLSSLPVSVPASRAAAQLLSELNRIGVNVNQLAFAFNADREFKGDWQALRDELTRVLDKVARAYDP